MKATRRSVYKPNRVFWSLVGYGTLSLQLSEFRLLLPTWPL